VIDHHDWHLTLMQNSRPVTTEVNFPIKNALWGLKIEEK